MKLKLNDKHVRELLPDYMAGNMSRLTAWRVRRHASKCADCAAELHRYQQISQALGDEIGVLNVPNSLRMNIVDLIRTAELRPHRRTTPVWVLAVAPTVLIALLAVALLLILSPWDAGAATEHGTVSVVRANRVVLQGTFDYQSSEEWNQTMKGTGSGFSGDPQPFTVSPAADVQLLPDEAAILQRSGGAGRLVTVARLIEMADDRGSSSADFLKLLIFRANGDIVTIEAEFMNIEGDVVEIRVELE